MIQQVNLYTDELKPRKEPLKATTASLLVLVAMVLMGALAAYVRLDHKQLVQQMANLNAVNHGLETQVTDMTHTIEARQVDPKIVQAVSDVTTDIDRRQRLLAEVARLVGSSAGGFSPYMVALARQNPEGLWLTGFGIDLGQDHVQIAGKTRTASEVPLYLQKLGDEPVFSGRSFGHLSLERDQSESWIDFSVATNQLPGKGS